MKQTPENKVKKELKKYLDSVPDLFYYSATAGAYSTAGIPDIMGCYKGRMFGLEVKAPGRRGEKNRGASALQILQIQKIRDAGGYAIVFDGEELDWLSLKGWLNNE